MRTRQASARVTPITILVGATGLIACLAASPSGITGTNTVLRTEPAGAAGSLPAEGTTDAVLQWNEIIVASLAAQNPFAAARLAAIAHVAMFEAVNSIAQEYRPYAASVPAPAGASADAASVAAAHAVLAHYLPAQAATLAAHRQASLDTIADGGPKTDGIAVGEAAAAAVIALRATDGAAPPQFHTPPSTDPGEWQPTPTCSPAGGALLHWRNVTTFGVEHSAQFRSIPPPTLDSGAYIRDLNEVKAIGSKTSGARPADRGDVAQFYNVVLAVGTWNPVARQLAGAQHTSLSENARAFALLNVAMHDALVTVMETKYHYRLWRPETAIRGAAGDGNSRTHPDVAFEPFIPAPCFPSYPSAHASSAYAAARIIQKIWGPTGHAITLTTPHLPGIVLHYWRIDQIVADIDDARVYGGIHFRFDQDAGAHQGRSIGKYVLETLMRPVRP
jgi:hypothetical protein